MSAPAVVNYVDIEHPDGRVMRRFAIPGCEVRVLAVFHESNVGLSEGEREVQKLLGNLDAADAYFQREWHTDRMSAASFGHIDFARALWKSRCEGIDRVVDVLVKRRDVVLRMAP